MLNKSLIYIILSICLLTTGCTVLVGKAVYDSGELTRVYNKTFDESTVACIETLKSLKIIIIDYIPHGITTEIQAEWPDGTPIKVLIVMIARKITEVSIRSGVVGVRDRNACEMIHDSIAQKLHG